MRQWISVAKLLMPAGIFSVLAAGGCTESVTFRVIDASASMPLRGVSAQASSERRSLVFPCRRESGGSGLTATDGMVTVDGVKTIGQWETAVTFHKPGFGVAECLFNASDLAERTSYVPPQLDLKGPIRDSVRIDGNVVVIRLFAGGCERLPPRVGPGATP